MTNMGDKIMRRPVRWVLKASNALQATREARQIKTNIRNYPHTW